MPIRVIIFFLAALSAAFSLKGGTSRSLFQSRILRPEVNWLLQPSKSLELLLKAASQDLPAVADALKESDDSKQFDELVANTTKFKAR